jgi:hypothetical protein
VVRRFSVRGFLIRLSLSEAMLSAGLAHAAVTPVHLYAENVATSVWDIDHSKVGVTLQISNGGSSAAANVVVTSVTVHGGAFSGPSPLPVALGTINPKNSALLDLLITVPRTDGTRCLLTIAGSYTYSGTSYGFSLNREIAPSSIDAGPFVGKSGVSTTQDPNMDPNLPPNPPTAAQQPFGPNATTPMMIPLGPPRRLSLPSPNDADSGEDHR